MVRCRLCKVSFKSTGHKIKKCWRDFDMCYTCAVINHPEAYPKNIIFAQLAKAGLYKSKRKANRYVVVGGAKDLSNLTPLERRMLREKESLERWSAK